MGLKYKRGDHCTKYNQLAKRQKGKREWPIKRPDLLERWGRKSVRTSFHVYHFPDLPCGEITIKGTSVKHCSTQQQQRKVQGQKLGQNWVEKKKRREHIVQKIELVLTENEEGKQKQPKKTPILEREGKECTYCMPCPSLSRPARWRDHH